LRRIACLDCARIFQAGFNGTTHLQGKCPPSRCALDLSHPRRLAHGGVPGLVPLIAFGPKRSLRLGSRRIRMTSRRLHAILFGRDWHRLRRGLGLTRRPFRCDAFFHVDSSDRRVFASWF
jgi:hypothetical protein